MVSTSPVFYDETQPLPKSFVKGKIYKDNIDMVRNYLRRYNVEDAEDLLQESFLQFYKYYLKPS